MFSSYVLVLLILILTLKHYTLYLYLCCKNYPLLMATWKVAPALAAGCTAVLKPSELASV